MFEVKIAPQAAEDLLEIKNYIEDELQNPIAAHNTISKIVEAYENLAVFPNVGIPVEKYVSFPTDYKFVLANNYSIFYRIEDEIIRVVRILYSRRDFCSYFVWKGYRIAYNTRFNLTLRASRKCRLSEC